MRLLRRTPPSPPAGMKERELGSRLIPSFLLWVAWAITYGLQGVEEHILLED